MNNYRFILLIISALSLSPWCVQPASGFIGTYTNSIFVLDDAKDHDCGQSLSVGKDSCECERQSPRGFATWWVSEPFLNLWVSDEPAAYTTTLGEEIVFRMMYKQRPVANFYTKHMWLNTN